MSLSNGFLRLFLVENMYLARKVNLIKDEIVFKSLFELQLVISAQEPSGKFECQKKNIFKDI